MGKLLFFSLVLGLFSGCSNQSITKQNTDHMDKKNPMYSATDSTKLNLEDSEWKKILTDDVYDIARKKGTERPFTGKYWNTYDTGTYHCAACGNPLFRSNGKFESSCGWPSFFEPISEGSLIYATDNAYGLKRTEVMCGRCNSHLGHIFEDGPPPTGKRYCINGTVLVLE